MANCGAKARSAAPGATAPDGGHPVVVAIVHLALVFALLAVFAIGTEGSGGQCFN